MYCVTLKNENSWLKKFLTIGEKTVTTKWKLDWLTSALKPTDDRLTFTHTMSALRISRCITRHFCKCKIWVLLDTRQLTWVKCELVKQIRNKISAVFRKATLNHVDQELPLGLELPALMPNYLSETWMSSKGAVRLSISDLEVIIRQPPHYKTKTNSPSSKISCWLY